MVSFAFFLLTAVQLAFGTVAISSNTLLFIVCCAAASATKDDTLTFFFYGDWGSNVPANESESGIPYEGAKMAKQVPYF